MKRLWVHWMNRNLKLNAITDGGWRDLAFEPFRPGITVHWIVVGEPSVAILKYEPGARAPRHYHVATETVLMLEGAQSDENGTYQAGDLVVNYTGSSHDVWSDGGCVALLQWSKPVRFL